MKSDKGILSSILRYIVYIRIRLRFEVDPMFAFVFS